MDAATTRHEQYTHPKSRQSMTIWLATMKIPNPYLAEDGERYPRDSVPGAFSLRFGGRRISSGVRFESRTS